MKGGFISGLRVRLLLLVLLAILPAFACILYAGLEHRRLAGLEAQREARQLLRVAAREHEGAIRAGHQLLRLLAAVPEVRTPDARACGAFLAELLRDNPRYLNLGVVLPNGDLRCSAQPFTGRVSARDRLWFRRAVERRGFAIGEYQIGRVTGKPTINFGYPFFDATGQVQGVVFAALDLAWLNRLAVEAELPQGSTLTVFDHKGLTLARYPDPEQWVGKSIPPDTPLLQEAAAAEGEGTVEGPGLDGRSRLFAFTRLRGPQERENLFVAIGIPRDAVFAQANRILRQTLGWLGLVALLALAGAWVGSDFLILRRLNGLVGATRKLATGELDARTGLPHTKEEVGQLARAFDEMAESLERREAEARRAAEEIHRLNTDLERRVIERTAQLETANRALEQAKTDAERANQAKSEFLSRMSHELRTPLNAILGFAQLLEMDQITPAQRESVAHILKGGRHLLNLINEVLDIARIETGRLQLSPEAVPVGDLVHEAQDLIQPLAVERGIRLHLDAPAERLHVQADRHRLMQVLLNLLANAVKYNREEGAVTLTCAAMPGGRLHLSVTDTGPGIPPDRLGRLFTPFDRLGAEQTGIEGTGLGLALSKRLVEAMGGTLGVESTVDQGSTFWVELPVAEGQVERLERLGVGATAERPGTAGTVLYIEDNLSNLRLIERVLAHRPEVRLLSAMQGWLGLDLAREHRPALILLDLHLPDMSGQEVLRQLRANPVTRAIPVVIISADATPGQIARLRADGVRDYLTKPLDVQRLLVVLDNTLNGAGGRLDRTRTERGSEVGAE